MAFQYVSLVSTKPILKIQLVWCHYIQEIKIRSCLPRAPQAVSSWESSYLIRDWTVLYQILRAHYYASRVPLLFLEHLSNSNDTEFSRAKGGLLLLQSSEDTTIIKILKS